ncbi:MAG: type I-C CRISPR-associated endonuclease Cas1c [Schwartzia sp. (in: firmicutes)]
MRHLLNTLFVLTEDAYVALENENVVVLQDEKVLGRVPLLTLEQILCFTYKGASPALMGACARAKIGLCFFSPRGKFLARSCGEIRGNVLLRKRQYVLSEDETGSAKLAANFLFGKIFNTRTLVERMKRDHPLSLDLVALEEVSKVLKSSLHSLRTTKLLDELRGIEGNAAHLYFVLFNQFILQNKAAFTMVGRQKRPPLDRVNAMLSFLYTVLAHDCASALEGVGLDAYVGFLHRDRPGRGSLALDLMEELRSLFVDRLVLTLINNRIVKPEHFEVKENGAVWLNDSGRKLVLKEWQDKKRETITHPFLKEKLPWGLVPYVQSLLLARYLRGDIEEYPAFLWK